MFDTTENHPGFTARYAQACAGDIDTVVDETETLGQVRECAGDIAIPFGKYKGRAVSTMTTQFLFWMLSNENIRHKRWSLALNALQVLRDRFADFDALAASMEVQEAPPKYWRTETPPDEKARKLRELEAGRAASKAATRPPPSPLYDAFHYVRMAAAKSTSTKETA